MVQLYYGDGKGKTTAAVGAAVRAKGCGNRVFFFQFLKDSKSSEVEPLKQLGIDYLDNPCCDGFVTYATDLQLLSEQYRPVLLKIEKSFEDHDMVVLDEILDVYCLGIVNDDYIKKLTELSSGYNCELVMTGHAYSGCNIEKVIEVSDYVSHIVKEKHPFDEGLTARKGIEY